MNATNNNRPATSFDLMQMAFELTAQLIEAEGVADEVIERKIEEWLAACGDKVDRHRYVIAEFKTRGRQLRDEAKRLTELARTCDRVVDRVKGHARLILEGRVDTLGWDEGRKIVTDLGQVYLQKRVQLIVDDEAALIDRLAGSEYVKVIEKIDRTAVTKAMKSGALAGDEVARIEDAVSVVFK
jgi:hypothetical protein